MAEKRYYWLKLYDDFFDSKRIKKLRRIAGGDTYTIIYLKMQLLAMKRDGILEYTGLEPTFAEELALDLDEEPDNVAVTINYLLNCGLLETSDNKEFFVPYSVVNTGSEGTSAKRMRELRERKKAIESPPVVTPASLCDEEASHRYGEKEIDTRDRDKRLEIETRGRVHAPAALSPTKAPKAERTKRGQYGWVKLTDEEYSRLLKDLGQAEAERCITYVDESAQQTGNKNKWRDWNLVVRKCHREGWGLRQSKGGEWNTGNPFLEMLEERRGNR